MKVNLRTLILKLATALLAVTVTLDCSAGFLDWIKSEKAGFVMDADTYEPIEGAYVMAMYLESGGTWFGHSGSWCVRTKGMYTGADGRFHFPMGKGSSPHVFAIKPDHYWKPGGHSDPKGMEDDRYHWNIYLKRQDPAHLNWQLGGYECERPKTKEDTAANAEYLKIELKELIKYREYDDEVLNKQRTDATRRQIERLESSPGR